MVVMALQTTGEAMEALAIHVVVEVTLGVTEMLPIHATVEVTVGITAVSRDGFHEYSTEPITELVVALTVNSRIVPAREDSPVYRSSLDTRSALPVAAVHEAVAVATTVAMLAIMAIMTTQVMRVILAGAAVTGFKIAVTRVLQSEMAYGLAIHEVKLHVAHRRLIIAREDLMPVDMGLWRSIDLRRAWGWLL